MCLNFLSKIKIPNLFEKGIIGAGLIGILFTAYGCTQTGNETPQTETVVNKPGSNELVAFRDTYTRLEILAAKSDQELEDDKNIKAKLTLDETLSLLDSNRVISRGNIGFRVDAATKLFAIGEYKPAEDNLVRAVLDSEQTLTTILKMKRGIIPMDGFSQNELLSIEASLYGEYSNALKGLALYYFSMSNNPHRVEIFDPLDKITSSYLKNHHDSVKYYLDNSAFYDLQTNSMDFFNPQKGVETFAVSWAYYLSSALKFGMYSDLARKKASNSSIDPTCRYVKFLNFEDTGPIRK